MSAELERAVRRALRGNLWIDEEQGTLRTEDAILQIAGAQLKAVAIALTIEQHPDPDEDGVLLDATFTTTEAIVAISGIASLLSNASAMIEWSREAEPAAETRSEVAQ